MNKELSLDDLNELAKSVEAGIKLVKTHKNFWDGKETDAQRRRRLLDDEDSFRLMIADFCLITFIRLVKMENGKPVVLMTYPIIEWRLATTMVELLAKEYVLCQKFLKGVNFSDDADDDAI